MSKLKLNVDSTHDLSWLPQAISEVANASEVDLEAMRGKKWYASLWETITFSSDNEIRIANGVSNLAKLQDILVRVMVMLSDTDDMLSEQMKEHDAELAKLTEFDTQLLQALKKHIYGKHESVEFFEVGIEKQKLLADLLVLSDYDVEKTEVSKGYISAVMRAAGMSSIDNQIGASAVASLTPKEQELLYRMIMINRHLSEIDPDADSEIVDEIALSPKRRKDIVRSIQETAKHTSPDFFMSIYEASAYDYHLLTEDGIEFESASDTAIEDEQKPINDQLEEVTLSGIIHVSQGETLSFRHKIIHMQAMIHCEGSMAFENCILHYAETVTESEITFTGSGVLEMRDCHVEGHSYSEKTLIRLQGKEYSIIIERCEFINCCSFLDTMAALSVSSSTIINPGGSFVLAHSASGSFELCNFVFSDEPDFILSSYKCGKESISMDHNCENSVIAFTECSFEGKLAVGQRTEEEYQKATSHSSNSNIRTTEIFNGNFTVNQCAFCGMQHIFYRVRKIIKSKFSHCHRIICVSGFYERDSMIIEDCLFESCSYIGMELNKRSKIIHSKFDSCVGELFSSGFSGGVTISWCEFNQWRATPIRPGWIPEVDGVLDPQAAIALCRSESSGESNRIENCTFNGVTALHFFLIKGKSLGYLRGQYALYIENCSFMNCTTTRESGKLIKEWDHYFGLFNKRKDQQVTYISNSCKGLEQVKIIK